MGLNYVVCYHEQTNPIKRLIKKPSRVILLDAKNLDWLNEVKFSLTKQASPSSNTSFKDYV